MPVIDSRLLDCDTPSEITEDFNRLAGMVDAVSDTLAPVVSDTESAYAEIYVAANTTAVSVAASASFVVLVPPGEVSGRAHNFTINTSAGTVTSELTGLYYVSATFSSKLGTADVVWDTAVFVNDEEAENLHMRRRFSTAGYTFNVCICGLVVLAEDDVLDVRVKHNNAGAVNITTEYANISLYRIGAAPEEA